MQTKMAGMTIQDVPHIDLIQLWPAKTDSPTKVSKLSSHWHGCCAATGTFEVRIVTPPPTSLGIHQFPPDTHNGDQIEVDGKVQLQTLCWPPPAPTPPPPPPGG